MKELEGTARHPILMPDLYDNDFKNWPQFRETFYAMFFVSNNADFEIDKIGRLKFDPKEGISQANLKMAEHYIKQMQEKSTLLILYRCLVQCLINNRGIRDTTEVGVAPKCFVFGKDLSYVLLKTEMNIKFNHIPKYFEGIIYFPILQEKFNIVNHGILVSSFHFESLDMVTFTLAIVYKKDGQEDIYCQNISLKNDGKGYLDIAETFDKYQDDPIMFEISKLVLNAIVYISHTSKDLEEAVNIFARKQSKSEAQRKIYTSQNFTMVGFNFQAPRKYDSAITLVEGFYRWQHHGPGNTLLKLIFIEPHLRQYGSQDERIQPN